MIRMSGFSDSMTSRAELSAWIMFMVAMSDSQLASLLDEPPVGILENPLEHLAQARLGLAEKAHPLARPHRRAHGLVQLDAQGFLAVPAHPIGEELDQGGAVVAPGPLGRPFGGRPDRQEVVPVHAKARQAIGQG